MLTLANFWYKCNIGQTPTPTPTPQIGLLPYEVRILNSADEVIYRRRMGDATPEQPAVNDTTPAALEVSFTGAALDFDTVIDGDTFFVRTGNNRHIPGEITIQPQNTIRWTPASPEDLTRSMNLTLMSATRSGARGIRDQNGTRMGIPGESVGQPRNSLRIPLQLPPVQ